eukprot:5557836-Prymnesium_polylepis.1
MSRSILRSIQMQSASASREGCRGRSATTALLKLAASRGANSPGLSPRPASTVSSAGRHHRK